MNFNTGIYKTIYPQTSSLEVRSVFSLNDASGRCTFSLSGQTGTYSYYMESGRIIDNNSSFIGSYQYNKEFTVKTVIDSGRYNLYLGGNVVVADNLGSFSFNRVSLETTGPTGTFDNYLSGDVPTLSVSGGVMNNNGILTGYLQTAQDASKTLEIYDFSVEASKGNSIYSFPSGVSTTPLSFLLTGQPNSTGIYNQKYSLQTSAGLYTGQFQVSRTISNTGNYLNVFSYNDTSINTVGSYNTGIYIMSMDSLQAYPSIDVTLNYISGENPSIPQTFQGLISGTGQTSGLLTGSGYLYGSNVSGYARPSGTNLCLSSGLGSGFTYASGTVVYPYTASLVGSGYKQCPTGVGTCFYLSTGTYSGTVTGTVTGETSGVFNFNRAISGLVTGATASVGPVTGSGYFTGTLVHSEPATGYFTKTLPATFTGSCSYTGSKTFFNSWDLQTGLFLESGYQSFSSNSWTGAVSGVPRFAVRPNSLSYDAGFKQLFIRLPYTSFYSGDPTDICRLDYTNGLRSGSITITGNRSV